MKIKKRETAILPRITQKKFRNSGKEMFKNRDVQ